MTRSAAIIPAGVAVVVLFLLITLAGPLGGLRERSFDLYQTLSPADVPLDQVAIVAIDDQSLGAIGRWPWPRARVGDLVLAIADSGAAVIGLDLLFPEPDIAADGAASDAAFAQALAVTPSVLAMTLADDGRVLDDIAPKTGVSFVGQGDLAFTQGYAGGVAPIAPLAEATAGLGVIRAFADDDGRMRAIPLLWAEQPDADTLRHWPAFAVEMLRVAQGERSLAVRMQGTADDAIRIGQAIVPLADGRIRLIDVPASPLRVPARALLEDGPQPGLAGRVVIIAFDAAGLDRYHQTARGELRLGADLHAIAVSQMLNGRFLTEPANARVIEWGLFAIGALVLVGAFAVFGRRPAIVVLIGMIAIVAPVLAGVWAYQNRSMLIDGGQPAAGLFLVGLGGGYGLYRLAERRRKRLQQQFSQFLSPEVVRALAATDADAAIAVEDRVISAILIDIRSFTALSDRLPAEDIVQVVNHFYAIANEEIFARNGTVDKYMGDSVLAFWNAPIDQPDHADLAVEATQAIIDRVRRDNHKLEGKGLPPISAVGIIETGPCSVGNMGTRERVDYTAIGPTINMVARLEKEAKALNVELVTGPGCAEAMRRPTRQIAEVELRGFSGKVGVFVPA